MPEGAIGERLTGPTDRLNVGKFSQGGFLRESAIPSPDGQRIPGAENAVKAALLVATMLVSFFAVQYLAGLADSTSPRSPPLTALKWGLIGVASIWTSMLLTGMGVLAHDAVHRVLFRSAFWNELVGGLLSALALLPFYANRQFHLTHHAYAHQPGLDPEDEMHAHSFLYAATAGSVLALYIQYRTLFRNLARVSETRYVLRAARDLAFLSIAACFYFILVPAFGLSLAYTVLPMLIAILPVFGWRALSDHRGVPPIERASAREETLDAEPAAWERGGERRARQVTGWVVRTSPWLEWLWSHVNYHEVHHKYPWLSHIHLKGVFEATGSREPYLVVNGYWRSLRNVSRSRYHETRERTRPFLTTPDW